MGQSVFNISQALSHACDCVVCGVPIVMSAMLEGSLRGPKKGTDFYCVNGHGQRFTGENALDRERKANEALRRQLLDANARVVTEQRKAAAAKGEATKLKNRAAAGVCPCCSRSFQNLRRHMESKHPELGGGRAA